MRWTKTSNEEDPSCAFGITAIADVSARPVRRRSPDRRASGVPWAVVAVTEPEENPDARDDLRCPRRSIRAGGPRVARPTRHEEKPALNVKNNVVVSQKSPECRIPCRFVVAKVGTKVRLEPFSAGP